MNRRMIDLYKEACEFAYKVCREEGRTGGPSDHIWNTLSTGRFAELIVRECLDTIQRGIDNGGGANEDIVLAGKLALFYAYRNIQYRFGMGDYKDQEHFGVEE